MADDPLVYRYSEENDYFFAEGCFINELLNNADDPQVSVARARVRAGETTRWHKLNDITERYLVVAGEGEAEIGWDRVVKLRAGDVLVIPSGERQRITNTGDDVLEFLAICTPRFVPEAYVDLDEISF